MMPKNLIRFERLMYLSLAIILLAGFTEALRAPGLVLGERLLVMTAPALGAVIVAGLVWLAARRSQNWARWILLGQWVLFVILWGLFPLAGAFWRGAPRNVDPISVVEVLAILIPQGMALAFTFSGDAAARFGIKPDTGPVWVQWAKLVFLVALSGVAVLAVLSWPVVAVVGGMACDYKCNPLTPQTIIGMPLAILGGTVMGWVWRTRRGFLGLVALSLAPPILDGIAFALSIAVGD